MFQKPTHTAFILLGAALGQSGGMVGLHHLGIPTGSVDPPPDGSLD